MVRSLRRVGGLSVFVVVGSVCSVVCRVVGLAGCLCFWWFARSGRGVVPGACPGKLVAASLANSVFAHGFAVLVCVGRVRAELGVLRWSCCVVRIGWRVQCFFVGFLCLSALCVFLLCVLLVGRFPW